MPVAASTAPFRPSGRAGTLARSPFDPDPILQRLARGEVVFGELGLRIDRRGDWHHHGRRIERRPMVELFAGVLHRTADGTHWLVTPGEQGRVEVEDAAFTAVELVLHDAGRGQRLAFRTNLDRWLTASAEHPLHCRETPDGGGVAPYLAVGRGLEARVIQAVYYELAELALPGPDGGPLGVWSAGIFFPLDGGPA